MENAGSKSLSQIYVNAIMQMNATNWVLTFICNLLCDSSSPCVGQNINLWTGFYMCVYLLVSYDMFTLEILSGKWKKKKAPALYLNLQIYRSLSYLSTKATWCLYSPNKWPQLMYILVLKHTYCAFSNLRHMRHTEHLQATYSRCVCSTCSGVSDSLSACECIYVSVRAILANIASSQISYSSTTQHLAEKREKFSFYLDIVNILRFEKMLIYCVL